MQRIITLSLCCALLLATAAMARPTGKETMIVPADELRRVVTDYIQERTARLDVETSIRKLSLTGDLTLPKGTITYEVVAPQQWEGWGHANLALIVRVDDRVERNLPVRVEVAALAEMVVSTRPLERGETIAAADVTLQRRDLAGINGKICRNLDEVVGKRARVGMRGNAPVRSDYLEKVPVVKSGQQVTILVENELLRLTAVGRARGSAAVGDLVAVQNLTSQKEIRARVVDAATVKVDF